MLRDLVGAQERHIAGAAEASRRPHQHRHLLRIARVEIADAVGVGLLGRPRDLEAASGSSETLDRLFVGRRQRPQHPHAGVDHEGRSRNAGQQRDLRVPAFDGQVVVVDQPCVAVRIAGDLLRREGQADGATLALELLAVTADLRQ